MPQFGEATGNGLSYLTRMSLSSRALTDIVARRAVHRHVASWHSVRSRRYQEGARW
jgi:hypothetical protein